MSDTRDVAASITERDRHSRKIILTAAIALAAGVLLTLGASPGLGANFGSKDVGDESQVEDLPVCYSRGVDAIGKAVTAPMSTDLNSTAAMTEPHFKEGYEYLKRCFAPNFAFTLSNRGVPGRVVPDPATRTPQTDPALQWANYVNNAFRGPGYNFTQHHMGSILSEVKGNEATIESYLIATHAFGPTSKQTGVSVVYGTYRDVAVKIKGRWMLTRRTLDSWVSVPIARP